MSRRVLTLSPASPSTRPTNHNSATASPPPDASVEDDDDDDDDDDDEGSEEVDYGRVARCLELRGVEPAEADYDPRFDTREASEATVRNLLQTHLGLSSASDNGGGQGHGGGAAKLEQCIIGLVEAFDATYKNEKHFNVELFKAMARCFEADQGSKFSIEYDPPKEDWSDAKKVYPSVLVITKRRKESEHGEEGRVPEEGKEEEEEASRPDGPRPSTGSADDGFSAFAAAAATVSSAGNVFQRITRRMAHTFDKNKRRKRSITSQEGIEKGRPRGGGRCGGSAGGDEGARWDPFVAHAHFFSGATVHVDESNRTTTETWEEKQGLPPPPRRAPQRTEYALGFAREVFRPVNPYGIVRETSRLDHAIVVLSRDATVAKSAGISGWSVCQVLATVEIKMSDSTCHQFERTPDKSRIKINRSDLEKRKGGAGPLGQEVLYTLGRVVWGRAAMGLELPPLLPLAVVAARRVEEADMSKMRWVYGNLIVPEECGGEFSFHVSSCGAFQGTEPASAVAAYMTVLMEGLQAGERWIESMQTNATAKKAPPMSPPHGARGQSPADIDTRPWPRSLCGRRLYFGGWPLEISDIELVATPASMRRMEFAVSQGELYRGRLNLSELRDKVKGWSWNVLWSNTSDSQKIATLPLENDARSKSRQEEDLGVGQAVIIKITSVACHRMLLRPSRALLWDLADEEEWSEVVQSILPLISASLHAVHLIGSISGKLGLVQIMPDLQTAGYFPLRPECLPDKALMCEAFKTFIERTLVRLARRRVVHADIRPMYQETANILCRSRTDYSMLLIDLDSLMKIDQFHSLPKDDRILSPKNGPYSKGIESALEFVCLQSVCIATSWLIGKVMGDSDKSAQSKLEEELKTETIIKSFLLANVNEGKNFDKHERKQFFSTLKSDPCSFVFRHVDPILENFLRVESKLQNSDDAS